MKVKNIISVQDLYDAENVYKGIELAISSYLPYPERLVKPVLTDNKSLAAAKEYFEKMEIYDAAKYEYNIALNEVKEYNNKVDQVIEHFIKDQSGLLTIPEEYQNKVYERAYSEGHSSGLYEVYIHLCELVNIFN